eukprot:CAMPEP_0172031588 /NCGR_PEP_ID=MMETSP1041-20130122/19389_1 /TAXON_ID=464988 /ORGANISM="Hemiselmis andersenii, Strain CCMP439" /LENGTH=277 /DNA_ID=CAMNT_0012688117 /DNA_START=47 /DNA_END=880 /DNA_ORIENTATION=+
MAATVMSRLGMGSLSRAGIGRLSLFAHQQLRTPAPHSRLLSSSSLSYKMIGDPLHRVPALATPPGPKGGLVVLQEWWGINDQVKKTATDMAVATGCRVIVPDLFRSKQAYEAAEAQHLLEGLDWEGALHDVNASALHLRSEGCDKVAVMGFCMGGALALGAANLLPDVDAAVCFYGWNKGLSDVSRMSVPVQCHFGNKDDIPGFSDKAAADELKGLLEGSGCMLEFYQYLELGHGFMNGTEWGKEMNAKLGRPPIRDDCIADATSRSVDFLRKHILS